MVISVVPKDMGCQLRESDLPLFDPDLPYPLRLCHSAGSLDRLMSDPAWYALTYLEGKRMSEREATLNAGTVYHGALEAGDRALLATGRWQDAAECARCAAIAALSEPLREDRYRTPDALLAAVEGYWPCWADDPHEPLAVEIPWAFRLPITSPSGRPYWICGRYDGLVRWRGLVCGLERKHTSKTIEGVSAEQYWRSYRNSVQTRTYALTLYCGTGNVHVVLDACQLFTAEPKRGERTPPRYARNIFEFTPADLSAHLADICGWLKAAEGWGAAGHYPRRPSEWGPGWTMQDELELPPGDRGRGMGWAEPRHPFVSITAEN